MFNVLWEMFQYIWIVIDTITLGKMQCDFGCNGHFFNKKLIMFLNLYKYFYDLA